MAKLQILSTSESREFEAMEKIVDSKSSLKGRENSWEVWSALRVIQSGRLYREKHKSFFSYLKSKGIEQSRASRGISALNVRDSIEEKLWLYDGSKLSMIMTERHLRELVGLEEDLIPDVFKLACELAGSNAVTFNHLKTARSRLSSPKSARRTLSRIDESGENVPDVMAEAFSARYALSDISERIRLIVLELQSIASRPGGQYLQFDEIHAGLSRISRAISQSGFGVTCRGCGGSGCDSCGDTGFFPKRRLREE
jgi:hypothetical protein